MSLRKIAFLYLILVAFCSFATSQTQPSDPKPAVAGSPSDSDKEKKQKEIQDRVQQMLDQSVNDANGLRLPQNKAIVFALAGDMYWRFDEKHARDLFRSAANELNTYYANAEREEAERSMNGFVMPDPSEDVRSQIMAIVAGRDPELAYQMLLQTRPQKLADAMARASSQAPDSRQAGPTGAAAAQGQNGGRRGNSDQQDVNEELALEQRLAAAAAANDPDAAIKLIKDSLSKGVTNQVLPLLQNLYKKDDKKATELAGEAVSSLLMADMAANQQPFNAALNFLNFATRPQQPSDTSVNPSVDAASKPGTLPEKQFSFTDSQIRDLANKIANTLAAAPPSQQTANMINRALPILQRVAPERIALLDQKLAESQKTLRNAGKAQQRQVRQFDRNASPEEMLAQIPKLTTANEKRIAYQSIASKVAQIKDNDTRAQRLIDQIGDERIRASAQQQFNAAKANRAAAAGQLEEAHRMIGTVTDPRQRIQKLVALALVLHKNGTEKDLDAAGGVMKEARALIKDTPEDEDDIADLMEVVRGYATIDPDAAFRLAEPTFDIFNDTINAAAVLSKYNKRDRSFKRGELILRLNAAQGGGGGSAAGLGNSVMLFRYLPQIQLLGRADLDRMSSIADRFTRGDARTIVRLFVLQGYLSREKRPAGRAPQPQPARAGIL